MPPADRFVDRLLPDTYQGDEAVQLDYGDASAAVVVPERIFARVQCMARGQELRIEPLFSEFWANLREGAIVPVQEGARVVGHATVEKVVFAERFTQAVGTFVRNAKEFCSFIKEAGKLALNERMLDARRYLLALYAAALSLPAVEPTGDAKAGRSPRAAKRLARVRSVRELLGGVRPVQAGPAGGRIAFGRSP
jgi:hypothetical protein